MTPKTHKGASLNLFQEILWLEYTEIPALDFRDKRITLSYKDNSFLFLEKEFYKTSKNSFPLNLPTDDLDNAQKCSVIDNQRRLISIIKSFSEKIFGLLSNSYLDHRSRTENVHVCVLSSFSFLKRVLISRHKE